MAHEPPNASPESPARIKPGRYPSLAPHVADPQRAPRRALVIGRLFVVLVTLGMLGLLVRVAQLQHQPDPRVARLIESQKSRTTLMARRGNLLDRHGRVIATTRVGQTLFVDPQLIDDPGIFPETVAHHLDYDPAMIAQQIGQRPGSRYVVLDRVMPPDRLARLDDLRLPGLQTHPVLVREYPMGDLAGQVIGFVGRDGQGLEGLEAMLDARLAGRPGQVRYWRDARRQPLWVEQAQYQRPQAGQAVRLTLDVTIQSIAQEELTLACEAFDAQSGQIIVMQPKMGHILAMANYPSFDPAAFTSTPPELRRNRSVTDPYEPGSIFKPFVWAMLTDAGLARPNETFDCTTAGVWVSPKGRRLRDASAQGTLSWDQVLMKSSNIGMAKAALRADERALHDMVRSFGFGQLTGSGLPGESAGIVNPLKKWNHYSMTSVPMGQEVAVTSLQLVRAMAVIANGGLMVRPTLIQPQADDPAQTVSILERVLSPETAGHTRDVLRRAVLEGTGRHANSKLYSIWGKTGTAQVAKQDGRGYEEGQYIGSFLAAAPVDEPQVVVIVSIHRPDRSKGYYGGLVAAPAGKRLIERTLAYLGVDPDVEHDEMRDRRVAWAR